jgi:hypothetical protein
MSNSKMRNGLRDGLDGLSAKRPCRMKCCDCYIGYIHMPELRLDDVIGNSLLERIASDRQRIHATRLIRN